MSQPREDRPRVDPQLYTEEYFRTACEGFDEFNESDGERLSRRLNEAFALAEVAPGMRVLDVGCGRGEILRHCANLGADAWGIDYAPVAVSMSQTVIANTRSATGKTGVAQADAKHLPFPDNYFDRALMFDVVEHLYPWELHQSLLEVRRVLKPDGLFVVHTAPNIWYDRYAYPIVRRFRRWQGAPSQTYPDDPRAFNVDHNVHVHVNEQSGFSMWQTLRRAGFRSRVWLNSPPQSRDETATFAALRHVLFDWPPFRWFFQREVFAVAYPLQR